MLAPLNNLFLSNKFFKCETKPNPEMSVIFLILCFLNNWYINKLDESFH